MYNNRVFEDVKSMLTMQQVLERYNIPVKRGWAICPFHADHKPSLKIYKNSYFCFVCGAGGDLIRFVTDYCKVRPIDACKILIQDFGLPIDIDANMSGLRASDAVARRKQAAADKKRTEEWLEELERKACDCHREMYNAMNAENSTQAQIDWACHWITDVNMLLDEIHNDPDNVIKDRKYWDDRIRKMFRGDKQKRPSG